MKTNIFLDNSNKYFPPPIGVQLHTNQEGVIMLYIIYTHIYIIYQINLIFSLLENFEGDLGNLSVHYLIGKFKVFSLDFT